MNIILHSEIQTCFERIDKIKKYIEMNYGPIILQLEPNSTEDNNYKYNRKRLEELLSKVINSRSSRRTFINNWNQLLVNWLYLAHRLGTVDFLYTKIFSEGICEKYEREVQEMVNNFKMNV